MQSHRYCVIMAGGVGSRFWPISREDKPKQFIDIMGVGRTFLQQTFDRLKPLISDDHFVVVTSHHYKDLVSSQLPSIPQENILCEPFRRNTGPCVCYAAYWIHSRDPKGVMIVAPSDHLIVDASKFVEVVDSALSFVETNPNKLVTLGMTPTRPETGYGYINYSTETLPNDMSDFKVKKVVQFVEKPTLERALEYLGQGTYAWNAGIFLWSSSGIISEMKKYAPDICVCFDEMQKYFKTAEEVARADRAYEKCPSISIDYAVMEKSQEVCVICAEFGWSDVGTWGSLYSLKEKDASGNVSDGAVMYDCKNCIVHKDLKKYVVVEGLNDYIVADTNDALLVCSLKNEQKIRDFVNDAKKNGGVV
ncbi:mannose-1-phosphate guanylyltransferase, putative [Entamoeba invadens IP1]|uniref:Mannose-1-phosphate guanylyltransferase, putative n=1 Tax=Entamoeba invadens IP1 TaxID=370355 RepID=A0A0A1U037_ENTIV|nr:mannose-1-phosphate guanylyltransferase, putative [Entamoeba invadens IP1]ELP85836.1 mannose-1-phosphate guanylyltransferase, putative [Entamoeba invadens IP1]|eukprot:XP_004185182.1 mannose-1-phosphate guanylyltransferase, putative [Entamoeba invadens IP1]